MSATAPTHYNRFIGHDASTLAAALTAAPRAPTLTITARDTPYYFQRVGDLYKVPAAGVNPYSDITVNNWIILTLTPAMMIPGNTVDQELLFLVALGLAMQVPGAGDVFHVDPRALDMFYDADGLFRVGISHTIPERVFRGYMRDVVIPGYILSYRHHTEGLPPTIYRPHEAMEMIRQLNEALAQIK